MKKNWIYIGSSFLSIVTIAIIVYNQIQDNQGSLSKPWAVTITIAIGILSSIITSFFRPSSSVIKPYNIAIIGFPRSGKTSLIVSIFQMIFAQRLSGIKAFLRGESTIERINDLIAKKEAGIPAGPTNNQSMFAYRTDIEVKRTLSSFTYRVEFGDYPGESSKELLENDYFEVLRKSEFFKWCIEADAYLFIIDVARYLIAKDRRQLVAITAQSIRQSWQHFLEGNQQIGKKIRLKPVTLIFNKMDLCAFWTAVDSETIQDDISAVAYSTVKLPEIQQISLSSYNSLKGALIKDYRPLIDYLKSEVDQFDTLFTSNFGEMNDLYPDINKILKHLLPNSLFRN